MTIRPLLKRALMIKMALSGIFFPSFQKICAKIAHFSHQSTFRKRSILEKWMLRQYLTTFIGSLGAILGLLVVTRFQEIATFMALGACGGELAQFIALQMLFVLPAVFPLSALVASVLLSKNMGQNYILTSLRAAGLSLYTIFFPIVYSSMVLSCINFILVSDISTSAHYSKRVLEQELKTFRPLSFLQHPEMIRSQGGVLVSLNGFDVQNGAEHLMLAVPAISTKRVALLCFDALEQEHSHDQLKARGVSFMTTKPWEGNFPTLLLDQSCQIDTQSSWVSSWMKQREARLSLDYFSTPVLLSSMQTFSRTHDTKQWVRSISEMMRRISFGLEPLTMTLFGLSWGMSVGRERTKGAIWTLILYPAFNIACVFLGKSFAKSLGWSALVYTLPHILLCLSSLMRLRKIERGMA